MTTTTPGGTPSRKAVLFCPECDHQSPPGGDWAVSRQDGDRTTLECPDCGHTLVSQPRFCLLA